jgi:hypothetical protein
MTYVYNHSREKYEKKHEYGDIPSNDSIKRERKMYV